MIQYKETSTKWNWRFAKAKEKFSTEEEKINQFTSEIEQRENPLDNLAKNTEIADIDLSTFDAGHQAMRYNK